MASLSARIVRFSPIWFALLIVLGIGIATPSPMLAQEAQERARWGLAGSLTPEWEFLHFLEDAMDKSIDMTGDEIRIGVVRGKELGGDWGVAFVRRRVDDGSSLVQEKPKCLAGTAEPPVCAGGTFYRTRGALLNGVQMHRFFPLATIARRVQIGAIVSGGVARLEGEADETQEHLQVTIDPVTGGPRFSIGSETRSVEARSIFDHTFVAEYVPIGGVEAAMAVIAAPGLKLRVSGGASFPGFHRVSLTLVYFF